MTGYFLSPWDFIVRESFSSSGCSVGEVGRSRSEGEVVEDMTCCGVEVGAGGMLARADQGMVAGFRGEKERG